MSVSDKPPSVHAGTVIDAIREIAREHGYAIGVHGSLNPERDIDLIAAPWVKWAHAPRTLMLAVNRLPYLHRVKQHDLTNPMPLGRMGYVWLISRRHASCPRYVDLSVMPRGR
jgi:hypothetical protein